MSILLIRHGETDGNKHGVVQKPEMPLNEHGLEQARRLGRRLRDQGISRILASDLARARMTAEAVAAETGVEVELEPLLQERNFGDLRGRAYASFDEDVMGPSYEPPGGESWEVFYDRAAAAWQRVVAAAEETEGALAVATHGLVCHALALDHLTIEPPLWLPERWANTSLTIIEKTSPWKVKLLNCTQHLDDLSADDESSRSGL